VNYLHPEQSRSCTSSGEITGRSGLDSPSVGESIVVRVNDDHLLSIGQFARVARLSVKQLRHYADLGLLPPARVDPATGYRYYRVEQARDALTVGLLRSLDVPLPAVTEVLRGEPGTTTAALASVRDRSLRLSHNDI